MAISLNRPQSFIAEQAPPCTTSIRRHRRSSKTPLQLFGNRKSKRDNKLTGNTTNKLRPLY